MAEPRMRMRQKGQQFPTADLATFLFAFGDDENPLPETVKVLDEIITDYIIEICHEAAAVAHYARRAKVKVDDIKFVLRRDPVKLGRVLELLDLDKDLKRKRKAFDTDEGTVVKETGSKREREKEKETEKEADEPEAGEDGEGRKRKKRKKDRADN